VDIEAGKKLGIKTVAVTCGIRSREFLSALKPDFIYDFVAEINPESIFNRQ
jgi:phosphoglycolate phosphatase-like HAD superfamily hydrolase